MSDNVIERAKYVDSFYTQLENAVLNGIMEVSCPYCGEVYSLEPDCYEQINCNCCNRIFQVSGVC